MAVLRVILGALEAGFYPGCVYLISTWYTRFELQKRNAGFYLLGSMASGVGGILAYGLMQMDGIDGINGWRWIFIVSLCVIVSYMNVNQSSMQIEGALTCALAIGPYFIIVDFPEQSAKSWRFLNEAEALFVVARIDHDRLDAIAQPFTVRSYLRNARDSKVWAFAVLYMLTTTCSYSIAYFLPIILKDGLNFSTAETQCLTLPPYVAAAIVMFIQAYYADKWRLRGPVVAGNALLGRYDL